MTQVIFRDELLKLRILEQLRELRLKIATNTPLDTELLAARLGISKDDHPEQYHTFIEVLMEMGCEILD